MRWTKRWEGARQRAHLRMFLRKERSAHGPWRRKGFKGTVKTPARSRTWRGQK